MALTPRICCHHLMHYQSEFYLMRAASHNSAVNSCGRIYMVLSNGSSLFPGRGKLKKYKNEWFEMINKGIIGFD